MPTSKRASIVKKIITTQSARSFSLLESIALAFKKLINNTSGNSKIEPNIEKRYQLKLTERKKLFWKYYRNKNVHEIYDKELKNDVPRMPRKFQPVEIENEPQEELAIRKEMAINKFKAETNILKLRSSRYKESVQKIDNEMKELFNKELPPARAEKHQNAWEELCKNEELKSTNIFEKKKKRI